MDIFFHPQFYHAPHGRQYLMMLHIKSQNGSTAIPDTHSQNIIMRSCHKYMKQQGHIWVKVLLSLICLLKERRDGSWREKLKSLSIMFPIFYLPRILHVLEDIQDHTSILLERTSIVAREASKSYPLLRQMSMQNLSNCQVNIRAFLMIKGANASHGLQNKNYTVKA